jgi:hypothetical protein
MDARYQAFCRARRIWQLTSGRDSLETDVFNGGQAKAGREDIACRLSKFCFVPVHQFDQPDMEPEHLTAEEVQQLMEVLQTLREREPLMAGVTL